MHLLKSWGVFIEFNIQLKTSTTAMKLLSRIGYEFSRTNSPWHKLKALQTQLFVAVVPGFQLLQ